MSVTVTTAEEEDVDVLELQGEVENMDLFDGRFNRELVQLEFENFVLVGRKVQKEFCVVEKVIVGGRPRLTVIKKTKHVFLFDKPPRYRRPADRIGER
jgi:hypothetical protein